MANVDFFIFGAETITNEKSNHEVIINHAFAENLTLDIIGEKLFTEYYELIENYKLKMYNQSMNN